MSDFSLNINGSLAPRHLHAKTHDKLPVLLCLLSPKCRGNCNEPSSFLRLQRLLVHTLNHLLCKACTVAKDQISLSSPLNLKDISLNNIKAGSFCGWPSKSLLEFIRVNFRHIIIVDIFQSQRDILK